MADWRGTRPHSAHTPPSVLGQGDLVQPSQLDIALLRAHPCRIVARRPLELDRERPRARLRATRSESTQRVIGPVNARFFLNAHLHRLVLPGATAKGLARAGRVG